jgi:DivIVA domain-containing protein
VLTAREVDRARFRATRFRPGYRQDEVDAFLGRVVVELRGRAAGRIALTTRDVRTKTFTRVRFVHGYEPSEVDALLQRVATQLSRDDGRYRATGPGGG